MHPETFERKPCASSSILRGNIIESNRQIAYKQEKQALITTNQNAANVVLPNNQWKTRLESGVKIEVGDEIQVEAVMVNTRGSPEETIEFSGIGSVQSATDVIDNKVMARFQKYITNRQQLIVIYHYYIPHVKETHKAQIMDM